MEHISITYYIVTFIVVAIHSFLNFRLCGYLSDKMRFHKVSIYVVCALNGAVCPFIMSAQFDDIATIYAVCIAALVLELFVLFKSRMTAIIGVAAGSLLHLFVLRAIIISVVSIVNEIPMNSVVSDPQLVAWVNFGMFAAQVITLVVFIKFIPLDILSKVMADKGFYTGLLGLAIFLNAYVIYNAYIFRVDYYSLNLSVQEIVMATMSLMFLYIMMLLLIKIFNLGTYKTKTKELEEIIDKDKILTSAALSFAEIIIELNCTKDVVRRMYVNSTEYSIENEFTLTNFFAQNASAFVHPEDIHIIDDITSPYLIKCFEDGSTEINIEYRARKMGISEDTGKIECSNDEYLWHKMQINLKRDEDSEDVIAILTVDEIEDEKQNEISLRQKAETDPLTGAYNKSALAKKMQTHIENDGQGVLYMFDLDNFKGINDNMGHSAGDRVLCDVYEKVSEIFRAQDIVGRVGGDEFVIFMIGETRKITIEKKAAQILEQLNKVYRAQNGVNVEISSSVGIALAPKDGVDFETLFNAADMAMYHSKNTGKNTYTIYNSSLFDEMKPQEKDAYTRAKS